MGEHTPEPWLLGRGDIYAEGTRASDFDDRVICGIGVSGGARSHEYAVIKAHKPEGKANARRIVACVNALAGISTEAIEGGVIAELVEAARELRANDGSNGLFHALKSFDAGQRVDAALAKLEASK